MNRNNTKKQVVFIMTDTQRKDMLGCYGNPDMKTPALDALASKGMRFEKAYTCQPVCGPARSALFTGTYPHSNGSWGNSMPIGDNVRTIGQRLNGEGIHTAYIGKWHVDGGDYFGLGQCPDGWDADYWYDMRNYLEELTDEERLLSRQTSLMNETDVAREFTFGHRCSNRAIDFIEQCKEEDFFLVVSYDEPHGPFICPQPYADMYKDYQFPKSKNLWDDLSNKPEHHVAWAGDRLQLNKDTLDMNFQYYLGCNSFVDDEIGRVIQTIHEQIPNALVIYTSDHGDLLYSHSLMNKGAAMYDEITNIPLIMMCNEFIESGQINTDPVSHIDMVPTIMHYFDLQQSKLFEGHSIIPTLQVGERVNDTIYIEFSRYEVDHDGFGGFQPIRCAFDGRYKLVINLLATDELYDLEIDPGEMDNLIDNNEYSSIRDDIHNRLLNWMNETRDPFRGYYWERRPWRKDAREASWDYTLMTRQREAEYEPRQLDYGTGLEMVDATRLKG
ncbi:sulfatase-like hydrolase/transferase [Vallitalea okinawensis]|uniref:sulfatase-like hydrolase/transferase n=1 Tax=Vallitalea okinawensis TaxID=2078660 RepID=UPI000CFA9089|nr:sulfatase-like hydrolase/transferase [Vallitalea okinawensis]